MPLLNYTSEVPAEKSIAQIQKCLVEHGATAIINDYDGNGFIVALTFKITIGDQDYGVKLPTDWRPVLKILESGKKFNARLLTESAKKNRQEQALRTAWKITNDWVKAQMAIIQVKMASLEQVFLPYIIAKQGQTVYEVWREQQGLLEAPKN